MSDNEKRMQCALGILINNMRGNGTDFLKPMSAEFTSKLADLAEAAFFNEPHEELDEALPNFNPVS